MDVAALGLKIESDDVVKATANLDKFTASADKAAAAGAKLSGTGNTAKLAQDYARAAQAADQAGGAVAKASAAVAAANAHVVTYRNHLQGIVSASNQAAAAQNTVAAAVAKTSMATQQADGHVIAYRNNLERLATANKTAAAASGTAATGVAAVGTATRASSAIVSGFAGILGGLVGVIIGSVITALIEMVSKLWESDEAMKAVTVASDNLGAAQSVLGQMFDLSTGKIKNNTAAIRDNIYMQAVAFEATAAQAKVDAAKELSEGGLSGPGRGARFWRQITHPFENRAETEQGLAASQDGRNAANIRKIGEGLAAGNISRLDAGRALEAALANGQISQKQYIAAQNSFNRSLEQQTASAGARDLRAVLDGAELPSQYLKPDMAGPPPIGRGGGISAGRSTRAAAISDEAKALIERNRAAEQYIGSLSQEVAKIGLSDKALRKYEVAQALSKATTNEQRVAIAMLSIEREKALTKLRQTQEVEAAQKTLDDARKNMAGLDIELQTMHLVGAERDREILRIQRQIEMTELLAKIKAAEADGNTKLVETYRELADVIDERFAKSIQLIDGREAIDRHTAALNDAKDAAHGFFSGWLNGIRQGENAFKSFANSVIESVNRIIDKMLSRAIDDFFNKFDRGSNSGGGGIGSIIGSIAKIAGSASEAKASFKNANGNAFDSGVMRFAKGGAFTNTVVNTPTLFRFANGAQLGEMGEAGPEAIMPLMRGANGKLGVHAMGGRQIVEVRVTPNAYFDAHVDNRAGQVVAQTAPSIMDGGAKVANGRMAKRQTRRLG